MWPISVLTHDPYDPWPIDNKQASLNPKQQADRPYVKYLNVTIRRYVTKGHLVTKIFIHITNKIYDRNKKVIDGSHTTDRLLIQQESRIYLSKV